MSGEEVVAAGNDHEFLRLGQRLDEGTNGSGPAELVVLALDEEPRSDEASEKGRVGGDPEGKAEDDEGPNPRLPGAHEQGHGRTEREAAEHQRSPGKASLHLVEGGARVVLLTLRVIVLPLAATDAAEVEAQDGQALLLESLGRPEHGLEVHHAAMEGMGVAHHGRRHGFPFGLDEEGFETSRGAGQVERLVRAHAADSIR